MTFDPHPPGVSWPADTPSSPPEPVSKLDAPTLVNNLRRATGVRLEMLGPAPDGQVGAAYVGWPDGHQGVLTHIPNDSPETESQLRRTAEILQLAADQGLSVPTYELVARLPGAIAIVQQRLPGDAPTIIDRALVDQLIAVNDRLAGLLAQRSDVAAPELFLTHSAVGFCQHEPLERYDGRTRRLLRRIHQIGAEAPRRLAGEDLVHFDFHPGNTLVDTAGRLTGIVDWDGLGRGDRNFALATLSFYLTGTGNGPGLADRIDRVLHERLEPRLWLAYEAHMSLRLIDWAIRHHGPSQIDHWIAVAEQRLARHG